MTTHPHIGPCCGCSTGVLCETCWQATWHNDHCDNCGSGRTPEHWEPPGTLAHDVEQLRRASANLRQEVLRPVGRLVDWLNRRLTR